MKTCLLAYLGKMHLSLFILYSDNLLPLVSEFTHGT